MAKNATELYDVMLLAICEGKHIRTSEDSASPMQSPVVEADFGRQFVLEPSPENVVNQRSINLAQAVALTLHFFADTEDGNPLKRYCNGAERWLAADGTWVGAYGKIAMAQIVQCIERLRVSPQSRRAIVSMGKMYPSDLHRPACWNHLHFLMQNDKLHMHVYQRSLNLTGVMPYDVIVLTNILNYAAWSLHTACGKVVWTVGSLHMPAIIPEFRPAKPSLPWCCILPPEVLENTDTCWTWLCDPELSYSIWKEILVHGCQT